MARKARVIDISRYQTQILKRKSRSYAAESMMLADIRRDLERLEAELAARQKKAHKPEMGGGIPRAARD